MVRTYYIDDWAMRAIAADDNAHEKLLKVMQSWATEELRIGGHASEQRDEIMGLVPEWMDECLREYRDTVAKGAQFPLGWTFREAFIMRFANNVYEYLNMKRTSAPPGWA